MKVSIHGISKMVGSFHGKIPSFELDDNWGNMPWLWTKITSSVLLRSTWWANWPCTATPWWIPWRTRRSAWWIRAPWKTRRNHEGCTWPLGMAQAWHVGATAGVGEQSAVGGELPTDRFCGWTNPGDFNGISGGGSLLITGVNQPTYILSGMNHQVATYDFYTWVDISI